jgi:outer membrane protein OmpA-like peptidoglycan-associated protein
MKTISRMCMAASAVALAGCTALPGANLGGTFSAEPYLGRSIEGGDFNSSLAREYQALAARSATKDVNWLDATAYIAKSKAAASGGVAPWSPADLGVSADGYDDAVATITANASVRPMECAKAQAYWDQYLESLYEGANACISVEDAKAMFDEALAACRGAAMNDFIVYFGFNRSNINDAAHEVIHDVIGALQGYSAPLVSLVGHTDTVGSVEYNQRLSEKRADSVEKSLVAHGRARGVNTGTITKSGRSELEPAVDTGDNVREPRNRRVTIAISE